MYGCFFLFEPLDFLICQRKGAKTKTKGSKTPVRGHTQERASVLSSRPGFGQAVPRVSGEKTQAALAPGPHLFSPLAFQEVSPHSLALIASSNLACFFPADSGLASAPAPTLKPKTATQTCRSISSLHRAESLRGPQPPLPGSRHQEGQPPQK